VGLPSELLQRRPDLIQAEQLFYAETARIGMLQAMRFPNFSITGALGAATTDLSAAAGGFSLLYSVGGSVLGPLFEWGKNKRRKQIQEETARQALLTYEQSVRNAFREVEDALVDIETMGRELDARIRQLEAAHNAAGLSRARYDGGQTAYLEVLETERSLFNAELEASAIRREQLLSYVYLYKALGGGWITPEEKAEAEAAAAEEAGEGGSE
jgi:multidrug efflux system outer membrane protein